MTLNLQPEFIVLSKENGLFLTPKELHFCPFMHLPINQRLPKHQLLIFKIKENLFSSTNPFLEKSFGISFAEVQDLSPEQIGNLISTRISKIVKIRNKILSNGSIAQGLHHENTLLETIKRVEIQCDKFFPYINQLFRPAEEQRMHLNFCLLEKRIFIHLKRDFISKESRNFKKVKAALDYHHPESSVVRYKINIPAEPARIKISKRSWIMEKLVVQRYFEAHSKGLNLDGILPFYALFSTSAKAKRELGLIDDDVIYAKGCFSDLSKFLDTNPSSASMLQIVYSVAKGIFNLHESLQFFHQDIKIDNILVDLNHSMVNMNYGMPIGYICDFGLCYDRQDSQVDQINSGTMKYLPPEWMEFFTSRSFHNREYLAKFLEKRDVYSFGIVLLQLKLGKNPQFVVHYRDNSRYDELMKQMQQEAGPNSNPLTIDYIIWSCLRPVLGERWTMKEVLAALKTLYEDPSSQNCFEPYKQVPNFFGGCLDQSKIKLNISV